MSISKILNLPEFLNPLKRLTSQPTPTLRNRNVFKPVKKHIKHQKRSRRTYIQHRSNNQVPQRLRDPMLVHKTSKIFDKVYILLSVFPQVTTRTKMESPTKTILSPEEEKFGTLETFVKEGAYKYHSSGTPVHYIENRVLLKNLTGQMEIPMES